MAYLRKDGEDLMLTKKPMEISAKQKALETPEDPVRLQPAEEFTAELVHEPGIIITIGGELANQVSNVEIYFKEKQE